MHPTLLPQRERELQPEQAAAAYEINKHVSVTAGPGSGKTTVLVERYLHILRQHNLSIDQIVAITFTNRAANEMRERLRERLNQILRNATGDSRKRWLNYKRTLDGAVITTIHGFCARLLREFPVEAGVDPQFLLLDEHRAAMLLESVVEEVLSEFISGGHVEISRLTLGIGRGKLAAALADIYRDVRGQGVAIEELALKTAANHAGEIEHQQALADLDRAMAEFLAVPRKTAKSSSNQADIISSWPKFQAFLQKVPEHETLADYCRTVESFRDFRPAARPPLTEHVNLLDELVWKKPLLGRVPQVCLDIFAGQYALEIISVLTRIDERLADEKHKLSALDFDDLELRTLALLARPEVLTRATERYKFFLVDEFQDTNGLQLKLLERLALSKGHQANLFIVGDRKQSIYGFRGADVDVFRAMTTKLLEAGGETKPLQLNFRSQPPLIAFFNYLFERLFNSGEHQDPKQLGELGYVPHEPGVARREPRDTGPLVEVLVTTRPAAEDAPRSEQSSRELDAEQLARRITTLSRTGVPYSDIALLFRAMTHVHIYESAFRHANIPYQTVLGRGFYEREEITDLIQLLRFLDNKTDELALAAVLRSPLCGISDNALLALRCAPLLADAESVTSINQTRPLFRALRRHRDIAFIAEEEHELLERAADLINQLVDKRHHYAIEALLRFAVEKSEYMTVIAANFDGAQRLANVQRLFTLAARFERSGTHLIRDFVRYVEEFEAIGSRESEGQIDEASNSVRLMTIHQAKGLEFPVVVIPDLQRLSRAAPDTWFLLDRHQGLTLKVPDGRGRLVAGCTFNRFEERHALREEFEGMRMLYVAATRAQDRLILSGAADNLDSLNGRNDSWLKWIWQSLELSSVTPNSIVEPADGVKLQFTLNLAEAPVEVSDTDGNEIKEVPVNEGQSLPEVFPLLGSVSADRDVSVYRFSVTQLINYQRCPRQYFFDRVLQLPSADESAVWNKADAPEPPANLTAALKGAVIHRFCERYDVHTDLETCLRESFADVVRQRQAELSDRLGDINVEASINDLLPLAKNYLASDVFNRVEAARKASGGKLSSRPDGEPGLWSELSFRLRRPLGILSGTIDKLLITQSNTGALNIEIIDFKTNRISSMPGPQAARAPSVPRLAIQGVQKIETQGQFAFDFEASSTTTVVDPAEALDDALLVAARDYQLQMQSYALAVYGLMPSIESRRIGVTLHFLEPNQEFHLSSELLERGACEAAIDEAMLRIVSAHEPTEFPVKTASHCRMCNFLRVCAAGRAWVRRASV